ncbi:MAG TPA: flagellar M-ring protein FliF [Clostridiales bacterium]|nr:flagellar M-ring protein FliF [Clostridiales bacterium]
MADKPDIWTKITAGWGNLSMNKKISIIVLACSVVIAIIIFGMSMNKTEYVPIFTKLDIQDSSKIVAALDGNKFTDYKLEDNGTTILVPKKDVDRLRLDLAIDGALPNSGKGFELFDDSGYAMTDADRQILYQRALQGELERSIESLEEVEKARVHLALSRDTIFMKEQRPATASIILTLKNNGKQSLSKEQIRGIISLVSGAVENLPEENVRVVDSQANLLSKGVLEEDDPFDTTSGSNHMMELEKQFENSLKKDLEGMLEQVFGVGKVAVAIKADLDFDSEESTVISYSPEGVIRSQQIRINQSNSSEEGEGTSPIDNNTQNYLDKNIEDILKNGVISYESITNNEIGETTTYTRKAPGEVKRISASVVYDGSLNAEQKRAIENIAMAAIGYNADRGDLIHVEGVPFDTSLQDELERQLAEERERLEKEAALKASREAALRRIIAYAVAGILLAIGITVIIRLIRGGTGKKKKETPLLNAEINEPISVEELLREPVINFETKESTEERSIKEFAQNNPDDVADLVRAWILEDER